MNLQQLLQTATVKKANLLKKTVEWSQLNEDTQQDDEFTAEVHIVTNLKFAAQERIAIADSVHEDITQWSRAISERLRFGENGNEKMSFEQASELHPNLGWALVAVILAYNNDQKTQREERAKKLGQTKNSGTSLSSTESAAEQSPKPKKT